MSPSLVGAAGREFESTLAFRVDLYGIDLGDSFELTALSEEPLLSTADERPSLPISFFHFAIISFASLAMSAFLCDFCLLTRSPISVFCYIEKQDTVISNVEADIDQDNYDTHRYLPVIVLLSVLRFPLASVEV